MEPFCGIWKFIILSSLQVYFKCLFRRSWGSEIKSNYKFNGNTVESHNNQSHIKDKSHINDVQAAYQLLLHVLGSSQIKDKSHINNVFAANGQHR